PVAAHQHETAADILVNAVHLLVEDGGVLGEVAAGSVDDEVAGGIQAEALGALDVKANGVRVGTRADDEVVFQLLDAGVVVGQVNAGVDVLVGDAAVTWDVGDPLAGVVAAEVVAGPR